MAAAAALPPPPDTNPVTAASRALKRPFCVMAELVRLFPLRPGVLADPDGPVVACDPTGGGKPPNGHAP